jgi:hypothetical protein
MRPFKFLNDNKKDDFLIPTMDEIANALIVGREAYLNGHPVEYNPFLRQQTFDAFDEGWELEHSYDILRDAQQRANNGL